MVRNVLVVLYTQANNQMKVWISGQENKNRPGVYISNSASDIFKWFEKLYRCSKVGVWACALVEFNVAVVNLAFLLSFANIAWLELRKCSPFSFQHFEVAGDVLLRWTFIDMSFFNIQESSCLECNENIIKCSINSKINSV